MKSPGLQFSYAGTTFQQTYSMRWHLSMFSEIPLGKHLLQIIRYRFSIRLAQESTFHHPPVRAAETPSCSFLFGEYCGIPKPERHRVFWNFHMCPLHPLPNVCGTMGRILSWAYSSGTYGFQPLISSPAPQKHWGLQHRSWLWGDLVGWMGRVSRIGWGQDEPVLRKGRGE